PPQRSASGFPRRQSVEEEAADRCRHGRFPDQRSSECANGPVAQPEALQGAARAERHPLGGDSTTTCGSRQRTGKDGEDQRSLHAGEAQLRLYGAAKYTARTCDLPQAGLEVRYHDDFVLPVSTLPQAIAQFRNASL